MHRIAILVHEHGSFDHMPYFLFEMAAIWREAGSKITVYRGPAPDIESDVAILHVDLTVVPDDHLAFVRAHPISINGTVADISSAESAPT